jgi:hypothetical protein
MIIGDRIVTSSYELKTGNAHVESLSLFGRTSELEVKIAFAQADGWKLIKWSGFSAYLERNIPNTKTVVSSDEASNV